MSDDLERLGFVLEPEADGMRAVAQETADHLWP